MYDETAQVVENRPLAGSHFLLSLYSPKQARAARPGQFAMIRLPGRSDVILRRPMSIYDVRSRDLKGGYGLERHGQRPAVLQVLYKVVGRGTRLMAELTPGDRLAVLAPLGHGFFPEEYLAQARDASEVLLVAGGIGIAALLMPARDLARQKIPQRLFFGGRSRHDLVGLSDFKPLVEAITLATEDGSRGYRGYVTAPLAQYLEQRCEQRFLILACGPMAMLQVTAGLAERYNHPCLVSMENRMGCALGVCLGCSIRVRGEGHAAYERVCTEGPVFWSDHVVWNP
jgi:dihydroorotate dehydrogenase electron transfer subunit